MTKAEAIAALREKVTEMRGIAAQIDAGSLNSDDVHDVSGAARGAIDWRDLEVATVKCSHPNLIENAGGVFGDYYHCPDCKAWWN